MYCENLTINEEKQNFAKKLSKIINKGIDIFVFLSTLFIGADILGLKVGVNLRLDQLFLFIASLLMTMKNKFYITKNIFLFLFFVFSGFSVIFAYNTTRAVLFYFSIIYNIIFVFYLYTNYIYFYGIEKFILLFRKTLYIQFWIFMLQFVLKMFFDYDIPFLPSYGSYLGVNRFKLWFYEPSYMATFIIFWFSFSLFIYILYKKKNYLKDVVMSLIMLLLSTSTSGYIGIVLSIFVIYLLWLKKGISFKKLSFLLLAIGMFFIFKIAFKDVYNLFFARLFNGDLNGSSGGRIEKWNETFIVFKENILFGTGPGCYGLYLGFDNTYVPSNVTLELFATLGLFPSIFFILFHINLFYKCFDKKLYTKRQRIVLITLVFSTIMFLIILQINQGYLRLYHWMFLGMINGCLRYYTKINKTLNEK